VLAFSVATEVKFAKLQIALSSDIENTCENLETSTSSSYYRISAAPIASRGSNPFAYFPTSAPAIVVDGPALNNTNLGNYLYFSDADVVTILTFLNGAISPKGMINPITLEVGDCEAATAALGDGKAAVTVYLVIKLHAILTLAEVHETLTTDDGALVLKYFQDDTCDDDELIYASVYPDGKTCWPDANTGLGASVLLTKTGSQEVSAFIGAGVDCTAAAAAAEEGEGKLPFGGMGECEVWTAEAVITGDTYATGIPKLTRGPTSMTIATSEDPTDAPTGTGDDKDSSASALFAGAFFVAAVVVAML
jgi:hypothetical protein